VDSFSQEDLEDTDELQVCCDTPAPLERAPPSRREQLRRGRRFRHKIAVLLTVVVGVLVICYHEHCDGLEAAWIITQVVTTIGYGDITFRQTSSRLFMSFYILWLLVLVAYFMNDYVMWMWSQQSEMLRARLRQVERTAMVKKIERDCRRTGTPLEIPDLDDEEIKERFGEFNKLLWAATLFLAHLLFGMLFYAWLEKCSCSYGQTAAGGCTEENACEKGYTKNLVSTFYMSIVTLTTVGFGDVTPNTWTGRLVGIPWMVSGIMSTAGFVEAMQQYFCLSETPNDLKSAAVCKEVFRMFDKEHRGSLNRHEFVSFVLVNQGIVDQGVLNDISRIYEAMDRDHDEVVTFEEVRAFQKSLAADG